ncbi:MAG: nickel insertion protein, partial [Candidatus Ranarchaeia archaeon]
LATPTGVALLTALVDKSNVVYSFPPIRPQKLGFGAGTMDFDTHPNMFRMIKGQFYPVIRGTKSAYTTGASSAVNDNEQIAVIETNVDDVTGEQLGFTLGALMEKGALDVSVIPLYTKKNRPAYLLQVITKPDQTNKIIQFIFKSLGTLGIRVSHCERHIVAREIRSCSVKIGQRDYDVNVKISRDGQGNVIQVKPEADDVARLIEETGLSWSDLNMLIKAAVKDLGRGAK